MTTADASGSYTFPNLAPGSYSVRELVPAGYGETSPMGYSGTVTVVAGQTAAGPAFGNVALSAVPMNLSYLLTLTRNFGKPGTFASGDLNGDGVVNLADFLILSRNFGHRLPGGIGGSVFVDGNANGALDPGEIGLTGVEVYIDSNDNGRLDPGEPVTAADAFGNYSFPSLAPGSYMVREITPLGYGETSPGGYGQTVQVVSGLVATGPIFGDVPISSVPMNLSYFLMVSRNFGKAGTFASGDLNGDGTVNLADLLLLVRNFGHVLPAAVVDPPAMAAGGIPSAPLTGRLAVRRR